LAALGSAGPRSETIKQRVFYQRDEDRIAEFE
jgi:hypothetical protein